MVRSSRRTARSVSRRNLHDDGDAAVARGRRSPLPSSAVAGSKRQEGKAARRQRQRGAASPPGPQALAWSTAVGERFVPWVAALATLAVFWHTTAFGFVLDDTVLFQKSASLSDLGSIARGFVTDVGALRKGSAEVLGTFYRPVFLALSTLYYQVAGGATFGWHLAAVVMAAAVAALAAGLFLRLGFRPLPSLLGALLFSFHPTHVSSVAWAAGLQEQLVALFVLLAIRALLARPAEERPWMAVGLATLAFVAALLSKEVAIAL
ncbi:MAG TPA: hypothetical protein VN811_13410, partial [Thermoanaerobaculia bacterium]|nr:hypothetical protein [Thermoanaerobaculia bacterium]